MRFSKLFNSERFSDAVVQVTVDENASLCECLSTTSHDLTSSGVQISGQLSRGTSTQLSGALSPQLSAQLSTSPSRVACQYPGHQQILAEVSDYFATFFESAPQWGQTSLQQGKPVVSLSVQEEDVHLAQALVQYIYLEDLPQDLNPYELLRLMRLSDKYAVIGCLDAVAKALSQLDNSIWDHPLLLEVFQLPEALRSAAGLMPLFDRISDIVVKRMANFDEVWRNQSEAYHVFLKLPVQCMKALMGSDSLCVSHENVVFIALADWIESNCGQDDVQRAAQADELMPLLRLPFMGSSLLGQLMSFRCVELCKRMPELMAWALRYTSASNEERKAMASEVGPLRLAPRVARLGVVNKIMAGAVALAVLEEAVVEAGTSRAEVERDALSARFHELDVTLRLAMQPNGALFCNLVWRPGAQSKQVRDIALRMYVRWSVSIERTPTLAPLAVATADSAFSGSVAGESRPLELLAPSDSAVDRLRKLATGNTLRFNVVISRFE